MGSEEEEEGKEDRGGEEGSRGAQAKQWLDLGPLCLISRGLNHSGSSSESV